MVNFPKFVPIASEVAYRNQRGYFGALVGSFVFFNVRVSYSQYHFTETGALKINSVTLTNDF